VEAAQPCACETAVWPAGTFEKAYADNRGEVVEAGIEADPVAAAIVAMMTGGTARAVRAVRTMISKDPPRLIRCYEWKGAAGNLLEELSAVVNVVARGKHWPKPPRELAGRLRRVKPLLRHKSIEVEFRGAEGHVNTRMIYITAKVQTTGKTPFEPIASFASVAISGAGNGSVPSAPKVVVLEEDEVYDHED